MALQVILGGDATFHGQGTSTLDVMGVNLNGHTLTLGIAVNSSAYDQFQIGGVTGAGGLTSVAGANRSVYVAGNNSFAGAAVVNGPWYVAGTLGSSSVDVTSTGYLRGTGTVNAPVTVDSGGNFGAGRIGSITTGSLSLASGSDCNIAMAGPTPGSFDQINVQGNVSLGGATLNASISTSQAQGLNSKSSTIREATRLAAHLPVYRKAQSSPLTDIFSASPTLAATATTWSSPPSPPSATPPARNSDSTVIFAAIPALPNFSNPMMPSFNPGSIVQIDPTTGQETTIWQGVANTSEGPAFGEILVESNGDLLFRGTSRGQTGVFQLNPSAANPTPTLFDADSLLTSLAMAPNGNLYGAIPYQMNFSNPMSPVFTPGLIMQINSTTGQETTLWQGAADNTQEGPQPSGFAIGPNGILYFSAIISGQAGVYTLDPTVANPTPTLLDADPNVTALAFAPDGTLYAGTPVQTMLNGMTLAYTPGSIIQIDTTTGQETPVWQGPPTPTKGRRSTASPWKTAARYCSPAPSAGKEASLRSIPWARRRRRRRSTPTTLSSRWLPRPRRRARPLLSR